MALTNRISRLFKADFHAVLDQIEEPELLLRQAIREMEDDIAAREQRVRFAAHEQSVLQTRQRELEQSRTTFEDELALCLASKKDELAKKVIRRKLESERLSQHLMQRIRGHESFLEEQRRLLDEHRATLEGLRQKAEIFARRPEPALGPGVLDAVARDLAVSDEEVEVAFLREQSKREPS